MYPVAATLLIPRFMMFVALFACSTFLHKILLFGHDFNHQIPANKRLIGRYIFKYGAWLIGLVIGLLIRVKRVEVDYSKWLGPGYKETKRPAGFRAPTYVSNHMGFSDGVVTLWALDGDISFLAGDFTRGIPFAGYNIKASEGIFCPRAGTPEVKQ